MRKTLIATLALALLPTWLVAAAFLVRPDLFYFRAWEYFDEIAYLVDNFPMAWQRRESGDLSRDTILFRRDSWPTTVTTDPNGFRSVPDMGPWPLIVFIGDSNLFGSGLSDNQTVPWVVSEALGVPVFNASRVDARAGAVLADPRMACAQVVVEVRAERNLGDYVGYDDGRLRTVHRLPDRWLLDQIDPRRWFAPSILYLYLTRLRFDLDLIFNHREDIAGFNAPVGFANGPAVPARDQATGLMIQAADILADRGVEYVVMYAPASGAVYRSASALPPAAVCEADPAGAACRSRSLDDLDADLRQAGVHNVNLAPEFRERYLAGEALFHPYHTHWNATGAAVAGDRLVAYLDEESLLDRSRYAQCVSERTPAAAHAGPFADRR